MKTVFKKSIFSTLCTIALFVGTGHAVAMQDCKSHGMLDTIKNGFKSLGTKLARTACESHYTFATGPIDSNDPDLRLVKDMRACCKDAKSRYDRYFKLPRSIKKIDRDQKALQADLLYAKTARCKGGYDRYITLPLIMKRINKDQKAPQEVQQTALLYAKTMCRRHNVRDWVRLQYLKAFGFLTVYNGSNKASPNVFFDDKNCPFYTSHFGGIYSRDLLNKNLTPAQRQHLGHEVAHNINGDTTNDDIGQKEGSLAWFNKEYLAQKRSIEVLFKLQDSEALDHLKKKTEFSVSPYNLGRYDSLNALTKNKPLPSLEKRYKDFSEYSPAEKELDVLREQGNSLMNELSSQFSQLTAHLNKARSPSLEKKVAQLLLQQQWPTSNTDCQNFLNLLTKKAALKEEQNATLSAEDQDFIDRYTKLLEETKQRRIEAIQLNEKTAELEKKLQNIVTT